MHLQLDPVGGMAGDMFIAAMLDAFPHYRDGLLDAVRSAGLPADHTCHLVEHRDHALAGRRFEVSESGAARDGTDRGGRADAHDHVPFREIRDDLARSPLDENVKRHAIGIFSVLAAAEAKVHGVDVESVSFHELGSWDSIADIVGAAYLVDRLQDAHWSVGPLPLGSGFVQSAHGLLPVPAPATVLLVEGFVLRDDGRGGERVTPTGAAILRYLRCSNGLDAQARRLVASGIGFGSRVLPGISNILRVLAFEDAPTPERADEIALLTFEVDDQSAEDLAVGLARLRAHPGVLDVLQMPAFGKKGRMISHVQVLARPEHAQEVQNLCFVETATLGVRYQLVGRKVLQRIATRVAVGGRAIRVKVANRPGCAPTAKAEMEDIAEDAGSHAEREALRRAAEDRALGKNDDDRG